MCLLCLCIVLEPRLVELCFLACERERAHTRMVCSYHNCNRSAACTVTARALPGRDSLLLQLVLSRDSTKRNARSNNTQSMLTAHSTPQLPQCVDMSVCHSIIAQVVVCEITLVTLAEHYGAGSTNQNPSLCRVSRQSVYAVWYRHVGVTRRMSGYRRATPTPLPLAVAAAQRAEPGGADGAAGWSPLRVTTSCRWSPAHIEVSDVAAEPADEHRRRHHSKRLQSCKCCCTMCAAKCSLAKSLAYQSVHSAAAAAIAAVACARCQSDSTQSNVHETM
jgi:hypothetical protein